MAPAPTTTAADVARLLRERRREDLLRQLADLEDASQPGGDGATAGLAGGTTAGNGTADNAAGEVGAGGGTAGRLAGAVRQLRLGRQVVPLGVLGLLWSAGLAAEANPGAAGLYLALAVFVWWWKTRHSPHRRMPRRYRTVVAVCGAAWLLVATTTGAGVWQTALLVAGGYALAAPYWYRHRIPIPALPAPEPVPAAEPEPEPELEPAEPWAAEAPELDTTVVLWDERVAARGVLAGARLANREELPLGGVRYLIQLVPGQQTAETARLATRLVASALGRSLAEVSVEEHPSGDQSLAVLLLTGSTDNVLAQVNHHPGFGVAYDAATGYAGIGLHADGDWARWAFYIPRWGLSGGAVFGDTGSGKSWLLEMLAATAAHTGFLSVWGADPTGGGAIPGILAHCAWPARSPDEILAQLEAMSTAIDLRCAANGVFGRPLHVPTPEAPGILLFLDELHKVTADKSWEHRARAVFLLTKIAREGRKAAVAVVVADQGPGLANFGDAPEFRSNVWTNNAVCLRLSAKAAKDTIDGLEANPSKLPRTFPDGSKTSGLGYLVGARVAAMRTWVVPDPAAAMATAPRVELDTLLRNGIDGPWRSRQALGADSVAAVAARLAELDPALIDEAAAQNPELADALARYRARPKPPPGATPVTAPAAAPAAGTAGPATRAATVVRFRIPAAPTFQVPATPATPPTAVEPDVLRTPGARRLYELIRAGVATPADLMARTGLSESHVHAQIKALDDAGLIQRRRRGEWEPRAA